MQSQPRARGMRHIDLTDVQLASSETARRINRDIVLELIRANPPISRADLSRQSGLQRSTVSQIVEQLIREKWVCEGGVASPPRGRRPTLLELNDDLVVIAVDIHPRQATIATVDLKGRLLSRALVPLTSDPEASTRLMTNCMSRMRQALPRKSIEGIGISLPGRVDPGTQRLIFAPNLHWPDFDLKTVIEKRMGLPVKMENAATASLLAELTFRRIDGIRDVVMVAVSEGRGDRSLRQRATDLRSSRNGGRVRPRSARSLRSALLLRTKGVLGDIRLLRGGAALLQGTAAPS